jgi:hypothetical protein
VGVCVLFSVRRDDVGDVQVFEDAYKSRLSCIILDNIERLLEYVPIGPRFSNQVLQTLLVLLKRIPSNSKSKLMVIATTSAFSILKDMGFREAFTVVSRVPQLSQPEHLVRGSWRCRLSCSDWQSFDLRVCVC